MKHYFKFTYLFFAVLLLSCTGQKTNTTSTQIYSYNDSCRHLMVNLSLELPVSEDSASVQIRDSLINDFIRNTQQPGFGEEDSENIKPYSGDRNNFQAIVDYYGKADYDYLLKLALSDYEERIKYLDEDTTMSVQDKEQIKADVPQWTYDFSIKQTIDTLNFVVYISQAYVYCGGAHGGVTGSGAQTFEKDSGRKIQCFVRPEATEKMQPYFRKGLLQYYNDVEESFSDKDLNDRLQIDGNVIPQPQQVPYPDATGDSLIFTYRQYEIACYADGMPSFKLAVNDIKDLLTIEGTDFFLKNKGIKK